MDFTPTEAQLDLAQLTAEVCAKLVTADRLRELDVVGRFDEPLWKALGETGVLAAALPDSLGGSGFGAMEQTAILRELGRSVAAVPYLWSIVLGAGALARFGNEAQQQLAALAGSGEAILSAALAEPLSACSSEGDLATTEPLAAHSDEVVQTTAPAEPLSADPGTGVPPAGVTADPGTVPSAAIIAERPAPSPGSESPSNWTLTGIATTVPYADRAVRILVPALVSGRPAVFLVDPSAAVLTAQQVVDHSPEFLVEFQSTPAELLGTLDTGAAILTWLREQAWLGLAATQLGTLERALELTAEHTRTREQFGKPLGAFQAVAQRLADAYIDIGGLRLTVTQAAWRVAENLPATESIHIAKFWAAEAGHRVAHTAVHLHGGLGIDRDHTLHNYFTAAKHQEFALGPATAHLLALGTELAR
ncbi:acyl-CoA dehydrogenase family protein [Nocardia lasii]|uniref:Acyl-CoA dehydrogenase family protein n=1 Tax=Nocardia lasii TaxID=1616107 RepID=A0ABW1JLA2_9NOCA